jgi:F0F1-type ATP synthase membrane subunit c/vacuolar-type H+-ATPase subunit K
MSRLLDYPVVMFVAAFGVLWIASRVGQAVRKRREDMDSEERGDFGMILTATLTLLGLVIGFTFSMAISRYDQRKNYEEAEANAIGTEYVRADLLPSADAQSVRTLLKQYLEQRIQFYEARWPRDLPRVNAKTAQLQTDLWNAVRPEAQTDHSAVEALAVAGMNDVLNSQGYTQAAWWNRIPVAAWGLMWMIAICCNAMIGYFIHPTKRHWVRPVVMPLVVAVSFFLIADIDSPRRGIIRVIPQNLISLQNSLR